MKRLFSILVLLLTTTVYVNGQDFESLYNRLNSFKTFEEYDSVDTEMIDVVNYLLSEPLTRENYPKKYYYALKSMIKWMNHTNSYRILTFGKVMDASHGDALMQNMFMAAMGKYLLEERYLNGRHILPQKQPDINYGDLPEVKETHLEGAKIFFNYLANTAKVRPNRELRKGVKAYENGTLEQYMFK